METSNTELHNLSRSLMELVERSSLGVVAIKAGAYHSASGVSLREGFVAVSSPALRREERVPVYTADGTEGLGTLLGREPRLQLAFLKVEGVKIARLPTSDPATWKAGKLAAVVGLTTDAGPSASLGILGAVGGARRSWRGGAIDRFVRLDANVYPSQAGAAVVDADGALIGMAAPGLLQYSTVALPHSTLNRVLDQLLERGTIRQGYLGVGLQQVSLHSQRSEERSAGYESGLIVLSVENGSPAERAGVLLGDVLLALEGNPLNSMEALQDALAGENVGREVQLLVSRGGEKIIIPITVGERQKRAR